jgi:hypothetical protein
MNRNQLTRRISMAALGAVMLIPMLVLAQQGRRRPGQAAGGPSVTQGAHVDVPTDGIPRDSTGKIILRREVYNYPSQGRRDPFASLIVSGDMRPLLADLEVAAIIFDPAGRNSVATLKDRSTGELYRARVGSVFGRIRITAVRQREVGVAVDEFGFTRQETLSITPPQRGQRTP